MQNVHIVHTRTYKLCCLLVDFILLYIIIIQFNANWRNPNENSFLCYCNDDDDS